MIRGMTGYARVTLQTNAGPLTVTIRSVNRRTLEISSHLPPYLAPFEIEIGKWVGKEVERGHLHLHIEWPLPQKRSPDLLLIRELKLAANALVKEVGLPFQEAFALVSKGTEGALLTLEEGQIPEEELKKGVIEALRRLVEMRSEEGRAIAQDLLTRCQTLEKLLGEVEERAQKTPERIRTRLLEKLKDLELDEERLIKEVALYAERADTTEELVRFRHHLGALEKKLRGEERAQGKVCEFILQELGREINTLGAKAQDAQIGENVVAIKGELEKIREQLQNVE